LRVKQSCDQPFSRDELSLVKASLFDHILKAYLIAHQNLWSQIYGKSLRKLIFGFGAVSSYEEADDARILGVALSYKPVFEKMVLKHQGIEQLRIPLVLDLNPGYGKYGNYARWVDALAVAELEEGVC
jgi:hypothetical protein